jgi:hypothetical protein
MWLRCSTASFSSHLIFDSIQDTDVGRKFLVGEGEVNYAEQSVAYLPYATKALVFNASKWMQYLTDHDRQARDNCWSCTTGQAVRNYS